MTKIAFIGLGNMGAGMAANQAKAGNEVKAFDLSQAAVDKAVEAGCAAAPSVADAVKDADIVITMLPAGPHVRIVYGEIIGTAPTSALLIDCSTIEVEIAREVAAKAKAAGYRFADAPVSGGTAAAAAGTLAFMVGCDEADFPAVEAALKPMSRITIRAGDHGAGQAAKICNNMLLGISMIGTCEAIALAKKLGLDPARFFDIASQSSGQCWSMTSYFPEPGVGPNSPADRGFEGGFATAMMLKDLNLSQAASRSVHAETPMGAKAQGIYQAFSDAGFANKDFSAIIKSLEGKTDEL